MTKKHIPNIYQRAPQEMTPAERRMFSIDNAKTYHWAITGGAAKYIAERCPEMLSKIKPLSKTQIEKQHRKGSWSRWHDKVSS